MRRHSVHEQYLLFYQAAAIISHANAGKAKFRQRDFTFFLELALNWSCLPESESLRMHNAQSLRFLNQLVQEGFAKEAKSGRVPLYRLTRLGLLELIQRMVSSTGQLDTQEFYFLFYFVSSYRDRIETLIAEEGSQFPSALRLEIMGLLDAEELLRRELRRCDLEIEKIEIRIRTSREGVRVYTDQRRLGRTVREASAVVEARYPYQFNSQRPLSKLIRDIPEDIADMELSIGTQRRNEMLFQPAKQLLLRHRENLRQMAR